MGDETPFTPEEQERLGLRREVMRLKTDLCELKERLEKEGIRADKYKIQLEKERGRAIAFEDSIAMILRENNRTLKRKRKAKRT